MPNNSDNNEHGHVLVWLVLVVLWIGCCENYTKLMKIENHLGLPQTASHLFEAEEQ